MRLVMGLSGDADLTRVERAIAEFRHARPVLIEEGDAAIVAVGVEDLDAEACARLDVVAGGTARLVLTDKRLSRIGRERGEPGAIALPRLDASRVESLARKTEARLDAPAHPIDPLDAVALELARLAFVTPAVVTFPVRAGIEREASLMRVPADAVRGFRARQSSTLRIASRAPVPLEGAAKTEFVVFRGGEGMRDQVAVLVGEPDLEKPVLVRLHSACLTGDLFGSLKCDCGDQLRGTVQAMAEGEGGILLYLDQEGRGNGIANKIRAYQLQAEGFDTYEADETLGFGLDQRRFGFAAEMLRQLGVRSVRVMTNNPEKIAALKGAGLEVAADVRSIGRRHPENVRYLATKRDKAGHLIELDGACAPKAE
ncbi:GTP cyclohydrolase-2 [Salinarimonas ramus]|uniref:GTP cyclohydrolase-2 n=2 Tax=Salinarimonas ramus TaxID=690164 RepID=A0A917QIY2_9HYPH|nr:GTP cyclohydrolase-2 [Salinarimonas ramus]